MYASIMSIVCTRMSKNIHIYIYTFINRERQGDWTIPPVIGEP